MKILKHVLVFILMLESRIIVWKYKPYIIAVTGSVGKTSTKDAIYCVVKKCCQSTRCSQKSMNSEIGLPLTIIGAPNAWRNLSGWVKNIMLGIKLIFSRAQYPKCLVLELGADHPGDIRKVAKWLRPDISVITKISQTPVHVEYFKSPADVFKEKAYLAKAVKKGGTLVLFADDENIVDLAKDARGRGINVMTYGVEQPATLRGINYRGTLDKGLVFEIDDLGQKGQINIPSIIGKSYMYPLLAGAVVGKIQGMNMTDIILALNEFEAPKGRMNIIAGINNSTLIDDTYNSSPDAVISALDTLKSLDGNSSQQKNDLNNIVLEKIRHRKIAVLGDMMELGQYSAEEHKKIGQYVIDIADILFAIGPRARVLADQAIESGMSHDSVFKFDSATDAIPKIVATVIPGDIILIKGSQSPRLEKVTKALLREPQKADKLIVRQEKEWLAKE